VHEINGYFYNGIGIEENIEKAIYWYEKAAEKGDEVTQYNLGLVYENGNDEVKAFE
jgi:TPR repeat protein